MKVCVDPGHGGKEHGTTGIYASEKDLNLKIALLFGEVLKKNDINIIYTRTTDKYIDLQERCNIATKSKCNYYISIHINSSGNPDDTGIDIFCHRFGGQSEKLARHIHKVLLKINSNPVQGVKEGEFYVLKNTPMPAILLQIMYITNPIDEKKLMDDIWQHIFANELAIAFLTFIGIKPNIEYSAENEFSQLLTDWKSKGIIPADLDLDNEITWREFIQVQYNLYKRGD